MLYNIVLYSVSLLCLLNLFLSRSICNCYISSDIELIWAFLYELKEKCIFCLFFFFGGRGGFLCLCVCFV